MTPSQTLLDRVTSIVGIKPSQVLDRTGQGATPSVTFKWGDEEKGHADGTLIVKDDRVAMMSGLVVKHHAILCESFPPCD